MDRRTVTRTLVGAVALLVGSLPVFAGEAIVAAAPSPTAASARLSVVMDAPSLSTGAKDLGRISANSTIDGAVGLAPRNDAALTTFISAVTTRGSSSFHHYLRPGEFASRFGPTGSTVTAVKGALARAGLQVTGVSSNRLLVSFHGSAGQVERAFHTTLARFRLPDGTVGQATTSPVELPASIAPDVAVVAGLDTLVSFHALGLEPRGPSGGHPAAQAPAVPTVPGAATPCAAAARDAAENGGLTDAAIANAYGAFGLYRQGDTGSGESVAIFELEPFARSDISAFDTCYFGKDAAAQMAGRLHVVAVDGGEPAGFGAGEALLDIEDVSALAPGANIDVYEAPNTTFGSIDDYNQIVSTDADQVVSTSWGLCETALQQGVPGDQQEENAIFQEAAAQGQTVVAAAGDDGSDDCNSFYALSPVKPVLSVDDPGSQPYVISAGGTTITDATQPPQEQVWNDGIKGGAGAGGISNTWVMPSWQNGSNVPGIAPPATLQTAEQVEGDDFCAGNADGSTHGGVAGEPCREVPDVSAQADEFTGAITVYTAESSPPWTTFGGTSSAAPIWSAMLTLVNASRTCADSTISFAGGASVPDVGFASPLLYAVASSPAPYAASFNDITKGNNDVYDIDNGAVFPATTGYDMASGLGSPQLTSPTGGDGLAYYLCGYGTSASVPTITSLVPDQLSTAAGGSVDVQGSNFELDGAPDVRAVWVNDFLVPRSDVDVTGATTLVLNDLPSGSELVPTDPANDGAGRAIVTVTLTDGTSSPVTPSSVLNVVDTKSGGLSDVVPAVTEVSAFGGPQSGGNQVAVFGSGFEPGVDAVTFGGVAATSYHVVSGYELLATVPAFSATETTCATALSASTDVCQTQVVVTNANGSSTSYPIKRTYEGAISYNAAAVVLPPPGCNCEIAPAASEYDYFPSPRVTSVSTSVGPSDYASENGTSTITIIGRGLNDFGVKTISIGPAGRYSSVDSSLSYASGTELQVTAPSIGVTVNSSRLPLTVVTLAGTSNVKDVTYSGVPIVSRVEPGLVPDTGGATVAVAGNGFSDATRIDVVALAPSLSEATVYRFHVATNLSSTFLNPAQSPAKVLVQVCTTTACSTVTSHDEMTVYAPGNPVVTRASPRAGPSRGGTLVTIYGSNLSCATRVLFGKRPAAAFHNAPVAYANCGSSGVIVARAPAGRPGTTVAITVETAESAATGYGQTKAVRAARFTYAKRRSVSLR